MLSKRMIYRTRLWVLVSIIIISCVVSILTLPKEHYTETALEYQSPYAGSKNLDTDIDPSQSSCFHYVTTMRGWGDLFNDDEDGTKRLYAIAGMQSLRANFIGGGKDTPVTYMDGCVVPSQSLDAYNIDGDCKMKTVNSGTISFDKTLPTMVPDGCMVDFSGKLKDQPAMTKDQFSNMLLRAYEGMNYESDKTISTLKTDVQTKEGKIAELDEILEDKNDHIDGLNGQISMKDLEIKMLSGEAPSFTYNASYGRWIRPQANKEIATLRRLDISSTSSMSITFWIDIERHIWDWRNVFHVTTKYRDGILEKKYDPQEDMHRRPAVFIIPRTNGLHICHDSDKPGNDKNTPFDVHKIPRRSMIGLIWSGRTLTVYVNDTRTETFVYKHELLKVEPASSLFCCTRFYSHGGFKIRNLSFYKVPLTREMYIQKYQQES